MLKLVRLYANYGILIQQFLYIFGIYKDELWRKVGKSITDLGNRNSQLLKILQRMPCVSSPCLSPGP